MGRNGPRMGRMGRNGPRMGVRSERGNSVLIFGLITQIATDGGPQADEMIIYHRNRD